MSEARQAAVDEAISELLIGHATPSHSESTLRTFLDEGRITGQREGRAFDAVTPALWSASKERSELRRIHGFIFARAWSSAAHMWDEDTHAKLRVALGSLMDSWWDEYRDADRESAPMAFHDETTAQRMMTLLGLRTTLWSEENHESLERILEQSRNCLLRDDFHAGSNNHGMFQDLALIADALVSTGDVSERRAQAEIASRRLQHFAQSAFTDEGVFVEHSPSYHLLIVRTLLHGHALMTQLAAEGLLESAPDGLQRILAGAERYATDVVRPDGVFPPVSDTETRPLHTRENLSVFQSPEFLYAVTKGARGTAPTRRAAAYPESGVGVFRERWGNAGATYVHFSSGYNAGYHKHSDEGSLYVATKGVELIREAGPYGYNYDDPLTKYAFSSFAHNGLVVDGASLPRHDERLDETTMEDLGTTDDGLHVRGRTTRFTGVDFQRTVHASSSKAGTLIKVDDVIRSPQKHRYRLLWRLGPGVRPVVRGDHVELHAGGRQLGELFFASESPYRISVISPESKDRMAWSFPDFGVKTRVFVVCLEFLSADADVRTSIRTGSFSLIDRGITLKEDGGSWESSGEPSVWSMLVAPKEPSNRLLVVFSAIAPEHDFTYNYRRSLESVDAWKLFVLDDWGVQGAYYYAQARDTRIFQAVQGLIARTSARLAIARENITTIGSSKGGTGAVVHGLGAGVGRVVAAAPQTRIGHFTSRAHPEVLRYIAGGVSAADAAWADSIVFDALSNAGSTSVTVLVGDGDHHFRDHVRPFVAKSAASAANVTAIVLPRTPHAEIGAVFAPALPLIVDAQAAGTPRVAYCFRAGHRTAVLHMELEPGDEAVVKWYRGSELIDSEARSGKDTYLRRFDEPGYVRARIYVRSAEGVDLAPFTTRPARI